MSFSYPVPHTPAAEVIGSGDGTTGVQDPGANGYMARTAYDVCVARTFQDGVGTTVNNGDGVSGDTSVDLADTAVEPGSYTNASLTVDQQGRITAASSGEGGGASYQKYVALLSQSGTDAPVATVLENTLGSITWGRGGVGLYTATLSDALPPDKTVVLMTANYLGGEGSVFGYLHLSASVVVVKTFNNETSSADGLMLRASIEIRVYP